MAHVRLADIAEAERSYDEAIAARRRAIEVNPDDPSLLTDLGMTLGKAGRFGEAIATLQQAYEANPRDPRPLFLLGIGHVQMGDAPKAREAFERSLLLFETGWRAPTKASLQTLTSNIEHALPVLHDIKHLVDELESAMQAGYLGAISHCIAEQQRLKALERENRELRRANEILKKASAYFAQAELDRRGL